MSNCECKGPGFCRPRSRAVSQAEWKLCQAGKLEPEDPITPEQKEVIGEGVGTEIHKFFASLGFHPKEGCKCIERANQYNQNGIEWCKANKPTIAAGIKEELQARVGLWAKAAPLGGIGRIVEFCIKRAESKET